MLSLIYISRRCFWRELTVCVVMTIGDSQLGAMGTGLDFMYGECIIGLIEAVCRWIEV